MVIYRRQLGPDVRSRWKEDVPSLLLITLNNDFENQSNTSPVGPEESINVGFYSNRLATCAEINPTDV